MVDISIESSDEMNERLAWVMRSATLTTFSTPFTFFESGDDGVLGEVLPGALACVRDGQRWSQLVPSTSGTGEAFTVFQIHFPASIDNSGFVGWLASLLKRQFGTGIFVICGQNSDKGGIYDYWGCPDQIGVAVVAAVTSLIHEN